MSDIRRWTVDEPWLNHRCDLGEGPFFEKETNSLRFVDVKRKQLLSVSLSEGESSLKITQLDVPVSVTADIEGRDPREHILIGVKHGLALLDRKKGSYEMLAAFNEPPKQRLRANDGAADPHGNFWLGNMTDFGLGSFQPEGSLYRFVSGGATEEFVTGVTVPNGIGWSPDRRIMYWTSSTTREIFAFDYDTRAGHVSNKRVFYHHTGPGVPDGLRVDVNGNLWAAFYGESCVLQISPDARVVGKVSVPTRNVTCTQFIGTELFITTAAHEADEEGDERSWEMGGATFRVDVGTTGLDPFKYMMKG